ncbi:MAG TPA: GNAT family N-acetyltransferase [Bacteroidales bacterium]|nr:GNAT family N-acetyltransferase [Bacteroidales bacterium]HPR73002.1 GNAT family N-acetyltransferase [Bacteroidales bacterium]
MNIHDLPLALELSRQEGWNQTGKDWNFLLSNTQNKCVVVESGGRLAGTATALNYDNRVAWIGMVLINKELRGQGAGRLVFDHILGELKDIESIKLDATPAGYPLYRRSGFEDELEICRMTNGSLTNLTIREPGSCIEKITEETLPEVIKYDEAVFGVNRTSLLNYFLDNYPDKCYLLRRDKKICAYMLGRDGIRYNYIGPVYAGKTADARLLISEALGSLKGKAVALDIMKDKQELTEWLQSVGFSIQRCFVRMVFRSNKYRGRPEHQYLISGPEYG